MLLVSFGNTCKKMRDKRFIAEHRGGQQKKQQHWQLMRWACTCAENVLPLVSDELEAQLRNILLVAIKWEKGNASVSDARKASLAANEIAKEATNPTVIAVARSVGHAIATAHMSDHSLRAAWYALKAVKSVGKSFDAERKWQDGQLSSEIKELVLSAREIKKI